ncbi:MULTISPECIES: helix-turn-helix domain-containing protein [Bradyrhizobium]|uniref:Transcriptional regulator with XRE-family HTH domain n=2 Tax=Nitrobacteraceae TaxID=41294 RepID=A0ABV4FHV4_BRAEL|nr:helix-turn-helix transcriptional regulator [Bradyrhizobium elkanii]NWL41094.1 helix-turn-helix transcriptional regulator [Bradyrhizobium elkanii]NWL70030.1 helix-turn-helix transcriptional regulator [Bradyrhizobium elkanii]WLA40470.1 helix-turn-helix transcriptional regulator [Bradyrhizobium elkanii]WLB09146.1 helix-turn-helix transcriptional regulator [Bradyrhizobium elkanii]WLB72910.1 helix-turn-helix transcriptional regulator [Bradyrhizobium elkanii]
MVRSESFARTERRAKAALGRSVKDLRRSLKMTQSDLAEAAGIRRALVSDVERKKANPTLESLCRIATALGIEPADLLGTGS